LGDLSEELTSTWRRARDPASLPAGFASQVALELGVKPVIRELHDEDRVEAARRRWLAAGYRVVVGEVVREDASTAALVSEVRVRHRVRPLARHPLVERAVALGGEAARRVLLDPRSPVYHALCQRFGADQAPLVGALPPGAQGRGAVRPRRTLHVARRLSLARRARELDRMAADSGAHSAEEHAALGKLLGYPACCVDAFVHMERRWPNALPIEAAARRTQRFDPRLNNVQLSRFAWIAHFPCRYDCPASLSLADRIIEALRPLNPALTAHVEASLARPRLYLDDDHLGVVLGPRVVGRGRVAFRALVDASVPEGAGQGGLPWPAWRGADGLIVRGVHAAPTRRGRPVGSAPRALWLPFGL